MDGVYGYLNCLAKDDPARVLRRCCHCERSVATQGFLIRSGVAEELRGRDGGAGLEECEQGGAVFLRFMVQGGCGLRGPFCFSGGGCWLAASVEIDT